MAEVGRPSELTEELRMKIKQGVLDDKTEQEICLDIDIPYGTFKSWIGRNYDGFGDDLLGYRHENLLRKSERNIHTFLGLPIDTTNPKMAQVISNVTMFTAETLGRKSYHKKQELDHSGEGLQIDLIYGKEDTDRLLSQSTSAVAQENIG